MNPKHNQWCNSAHTHAHTHTHTQNVVMTSGCSGALEMSITALSEPGQNILIPSPGFGLYTCLAGARGLDCRLYRLVVSGWGREVGVHSEREPLSSGVNQNSSLWKYGSLIYRTHFCNRTPHFIRTPSITFFQDTSLYQNTLTNVQSANIIFSTHTYTHTYSLTDCGRWIWRTWRAR